MVFLKKNPYQCFFLSLPLFSPYSLSLPAPHFSVHLFIHSSFMVLQGLMLSTQHTCKGLLRLDQVVGVSLP